MTIRRVAFILWLLFFPVTITAVAALVRQYNPMQHMVASWWVEVSVIIAAGLIFGRAFDSKRH